MNVDFVYYISHVVMIQWGFRVVYITHGIEFICSPYSEANIVLLSL